MMIRLVVIIELVMLSPLGVVVVVASSVVDRCNRDWRCRCHRRTLVLECPKLDCWILSSLKSSDFQSLNKLNGGLYSSSALANWLFWMLLLTA